MKKLIIFAALVAVFGFTVLIAQAITPITWTLKINVKPASLVQCDRAYYELWIEPGDTGEFTLCIENTTAGNVPVGFSATADEGLTIYSESGVYEFVLMPGMHTFPWKATVDVEATGPLSGTITVDDPP